RASGDRHGLGRALMWLGSVARDQGDLTRTVAWLEEALTVGRGVGDPEIIAFALWQLGIARREQGDPVCARSLLVESVALYRSSETTEWLTAQVLGSLGQVT